MDRAVDRAKYLELGQSMNGPGFYGDKKLREFAREYNNRVFEGYGSEQPTSFQIMRDFVEPDDQALVLRILPEEFYSLDVGFILEKLTDPNSSNSFDALLNLKQSVIYHLNFLGGFESLQIVGAEDVAIFGTAFVRHGDVLSVFSIAAKEGRTVDLELVPVEDANLDPRRPFLKRESGFIDYNHDQFYDYPDLFPIVFLARFDLRRGSTLMRYILEEKKDSFSVFTDDREMYTDLAGGTLGGDVAQASNIFDSSSEMLAKYASVFTLMGEVPHVINDLDDEDDLTINRYPTEIHFQKGSTEVRKIKKALTREEARNYAEVRCITSKPTNAKTYSLQPESFHIEQSGYWKKLGIGQVGIGKNGDEVLGKSWVTVNKSWDEEFGFAPPENSATVEVSTASDLSVLGEIYVMRSAQHPKDTYKVGYTTKTADERASQLQSTSGQPDQVNVIQSWRVKAPRKVEGLVHQKLSNYRVNPKREFFQTKYRNIRAAIEEAIAALDAGISGE